MTDIGITDWLRYSLILQLIYIFDAVVEVAVQPSTGWMAAIAAVAAPPIIAPMNSGGEIGRCGRQTIQAGERQQCRLPTLICNQVDQQGGNGILNIV
jgi:hypothetical protein